MPKKKKLVRFEWAMKYILHKEANFDVVESFLSSLLKEKIKILRVLESKNNQDEDNCKFNRMELLCSDGQGRQIMVEIQNQREVDYLQRLLWGTAKAVTENVTVGFPYTEITRIIAISVLYLPISQEREYLYKGQTNLLGAHSHTPLILHENMLAGITTSAQVQNSRIFPEYYLIDVQQFEDIIIEQFDEWVYFFKHAECKDDFKSTGLLLASKCLDPLIMTAAEHKAYENYLAHLATERDILGNAKEEGREEGRNEERRKMAIRLLTMGLPPDTVAKTTDLSLDEMVTLKANEKIEL